VFVSSFVIRAFVIDSSFEFRHSNLPLNILHVIPTLDPAAGGPPRIALRLAAGAAALGHRVTLLAYDAPAARGAIEQELREIPAGDQLKLELLPPPNRVEAAFGRGARRAIDRIIRDQTIVHTHSLWTGICRAAHASALAHRVPFVLLANGMLDPWSMRQKSLKKQVALAMGLRKTLNRAAFIHVANEYEKQGVRAVGVTAPVEIIPNGINPQEFDPLPEPGRFYAQHPELNGQPYILFLSRLHYKKGLDYLAAAFAIVAKQRPDVRLVVAGPDEGARQPFEQAIAAANLSDRVHVVGSIYSRDRYAAFRDAACFCLPSRQEGFSVAILEAMACGTAVVISDGCHFPEVAPRGAGEVVPLDARVIADVLQRVLGDEALRCRMGETGRAMVLSEYSWPRIAERMIQAYKRATGKPARDGFVPSSGTPGEG
jgi:glycosyltransferase involved in cell wall biosynthesis